MKGKAVIPLVLGLGMGLVAIKLGMDTVKKAQAGSAKIQSRPVVRVREDLDMGLGLTKEVLEVVQTHDPVDATDPDFAAIDDLLTRVTEKPIPKGTVLKFSMLAEPGTPVGVPGRIQPGYRAVGIKIDEFSSVAYNVAPGDWVDVIVVMDVQDTTSRQKSTLAEVVLKHVEVAGVGLSGTSNGTGASKSKTVRSVTLLVAEEDVPKLHLAATKGKITLAMRGISDIDVNDETFRASDGELFTAGQDKPEDEEGEGQEEPSEAHEWKSASSGWSEWISTMATQAAQSRAAMPAPPPPFTMVVSRGSTLAGIPNSVQQITYQNADSMRVLSVSHYLGGGGPFKQSDGATGATGTIAAPRPQTNDVPDQTEPVPPREPNAGD